MPIHRGQDKTGSFYQWGQTGKKYYFDPDNTGSKTRALNKAKAQQTAIYSSGWKGDERMKLIKVTKKDVKPKHLPADSRTNAQIKQRVAGYAKKVESLNFDIIQYLQKQINASNSELAALATDVNKIGRILDELTTKINNL